jgi:hypothetical protein
LVSIGATADSSHVAFYIRLFTSLLQDVTCHYPSFPQPRYPLPTTMDSEDSYGSTRRTGGYGDEDTTTGSGTYGSGGGNDSYGSGGRTGGDDSYGCTFTRKAMSQRGGWPDMI